MRVSAEGFEAAWTSVLGVTVDAVGPAPAELPVNVRPVPATAGILALGRDAGRWALLHPAARDRPRTGDEHLVQREGNPLFRVRYAHARARAAARNAADLGFAAVPGPLTESAEQDLIAALADHPRVLAAAADHRAPDRLARHLVTVADAALPFLPTVLPRGGEKPWPPTVPGSRSPKPSGRCWPAAWPSSASTHPTTSERAPKTP
ncbi:DALR anticodon-binding domain-containing protein [Streptomyces violaceorubidus]